MAAQCDKVGPYGARQQKLQSHSMIVRSVSGVPRMASVTVPQWQLPCIGGPVPSETAKGGPLKVAGWYTGSIVAPSSSSSTSLRPGRSDVDVDVAVDYGEA